MHIRAHFWGILISKVGQTTKFLFCDQSSSCTNTIAVKIYATLVNIETHRQHLTGLFDKLKGELNVDKKWQSDDLFYIIMNESRPRVDQF